MKKISLLALALSLTTAANAQMPAAPAAPCPPTPCPCPTAFKGFFLGGNLGYGIGAPRLFSQYTLGGVSAQAKTKLAVQGFDGGLILGYNYVFTNKLGLGLDFYFNWANTTGRLSGQDSSGDNFATNINLKNSFQIRVPFSYVICNLVAPKVMFGWDNSAWNATINVDSGGGSNTTRYNGFLWGAGVDFLLAKHVISGLEYTGVISNNHTYTGTGGNSAQIRPLYNKFAWTLKFIY